MNTIGRILAWPSKEVYVSFMYEPMERFIKTTEFQPHLDKLFGCEEWRNALHCRTATNSSFSV